MMTQPDPEKWAELLDEVAAGVRSGTDPELLSLAASDPEFELQLTSATRLHAELTGAGTERQEVLAALEAQEGAPGEELVAGLVHEVLLGGSSFETQAPNSRPTKLRSVARLVAGLAAAVLIVWLVQLPRTEPVEPGTAPLTRLVLGAHEDSVQVALGTAGPDPTRFSLVWNHPSFGPNRSYRVVLYEGHDLERVVLFESPRLPGKLWTPNQNELKLLQSCDAFIVQSIGIDGAPIFEEASAVVSRSELEPYLSLFF